MPNKKGTRRGNEEGSITWREDRQCYYARVKTGIKPDGSPDYASKYSKTKGELQTWIRGILNDVDSGTFAKPDKITCKEWFETWLTQYAKISVRQTTYESYEHQLKHHIIPGLGGIKLKDLQTTNIQKFLNEKFESGKTIKEKDEKTGKVNIKKVGLSSRTVHYFHVIIHSALKQAHIEHKIVLNPAENVRLPKQSHQEMKTLDNTELTSFLKTIKENKLYYAAYLLEVNSGMRRGEILGVRWQDISLDKGTLKVEKQIVNTKANGLEITDVKTDSSRRTIVLPADVVTALEIHRKRQLEAMMKVRDIYDEESDLVFCTRLGKPIAPRNFYRNFKLMLEKAGIKDIRFHDMRHTYAKMSLGEGVDLRTLSEDLGHTNPGFTLRVYGHSSIEAKKEAARKRTELLQSLK